jgi:ABC-type uncharacterized transport system permease subunit
VVEAVAEQVPTVILGVLRGMVVAPVVGITTGKAGVAVQLTPEVVVEGLGCLTLTRTTLAVLTEEAVVQVL